MKKVLMAFVIIVLLAVCYLVWKFFTPAPYFDASYKFLYIPSGNATQERVLQLMQQDSIVRNTGSFNWLAERMNYWKQVKPGKYKIESGNSVLDIIRLLRNGKQTPVNLVITKLRTKEDLASLVGRKFESDSVAMISYLNSSDLAEHQLDSNTVMTAVLPDTYTYFWNTAPDKIYEKLIRQYTTFWTPERITLAANKGLNPKTAYILASIVEEETNKRDEKGKIASVYLNRIRTGMPLGADPTVKFALRDFGLKRIYHKHLSVQSPYNTYRVQGLPPGPICTPSATTIDEVLHAPETEYLYFVAKSDFSGYHTFANSYPEHLRNAKEYQQALNRYMQNKQAANMIK